MITPVLIGGLRLPAELVDAVAAGRWSPPAQPEFYRRVFGDDPEQPTCYDLDLMVRENAGWQRRTPADVFGDPEPGFSEGLDPARSVVIGDLGPDMPFVLDYRVRGDRPRVLYLAFASRPCWREVAGSAAELLAAIAEATSTD